ncbi:hypothetical protein SFUMM280S_05990 [Streptomyces fumanus]
MGERVGRDAGSFVEDAQDGLVSNLNELDQAGCVRRSVGAHVRQKVGNQASQLGFVARNGDAAGDEVSSGPMWFDGGGVAAGVGDYATEVDGIEIGFLEFVESG